MSEQKQSLRKNFDEKEAMTSVDFDRFDPHTYLAKNASYLSFYGYQQGLWETQVLYLKYSIENMESSLDESIRLSAEAKMTEKAILAAVVKDPELQKLKKLLAVAKGQDAMYKNHLNALNAAGNNARTIESSLRGERGTSGKSYIEPTHDLSREEARSRINRLGIPD